MAHPLSHRQLLRVIGDLRAENRALKQSAKQAEYAGAYSNKGDTSSEMQRLEAENANMYHLLRQNRELKERLKELEAQVGPEGLLSLNHTDAGAPPETTKALFELGDVVEAEYGGEGEWYPGKIMFDHGDSTFDVIYDDGDDEQRVPVHRIRKVKQKVSLPEDTQPAHHRSGQPKIRAADLPVP